ncbi:MAG: tetratricopeptide repeat protein [Planctomycetota bacterium]
MHRSYAILFAATLTACVAMVGAFGCASKSDVVRSSEVAADTERARERNAAAFERLQAGELGRAEALLREAIDADVGFGPARNNLGLVHFRRGNFYEAAWEFQNAIKLMPYQPEPRNNLGLVFEKAGKLDDAVTEFAAAVELQPGNAEFLGNLVRSRVRRGDAGRAASEEDRRVTRELLGELVLRETRPEWKQWAELQLAKLAEPLDAE